MGPLRLKCERCGVEVDLPFRCNYCENYYCPEHRLPENHDCAETWRVKAVRSARTSASPVQLASKTGNVLARPQLSAMRFSQTEIRHLVVGTILVTLAGISFFLGSPVSVGIFGLVLASILFCMGFILHELAHKYVAQGYGLWAEFRLNMTGLLLTAISIVSPIKFIAPGAVMIGGYADKERMGRTAFAGPLVNVIMASALLVVLPALRTTGLYQAVVAGAAINAFLALFNLIPFSIFDGRKVYAWNRVYWAALFLISLALTIYAYFVLSPFS
jgi:Zn-dependent protease